MRAKALRILVIGFAVGAMLTGGGSLLTLGQRTRGQATPARERSSGLEQANDLNQRAMALFNEGRYAEAIPLEREVVRLYEAALGPDNPQFSDKLNTLAVMFKRQGDYRAARPLYERALQINEKAFGPVHEEVAYVLNNLALLLEAQADYDAARPLLERALNIRMKVLGPDDPTTALTMSNLGQLLQIQGDYAGARPLLERALEVRQKALGPDDAYVAESLNNLATWHRDTGDYASARRLFEQSVVLCEKSLGPEHPSCATTLENLGEVVELQGDFRAARLLFERAVLIDEKALGPDHPEFATALDCLGNAEWQSRDFSAAKGHFLQAGAIIDSLADRVLPALSFAEQLFFTEAQLPDQTSLLLSSNRQGADLENAYSVLFRWKGLLTDLLRRQRAVLRLSKDTRYGQEVERLQAVRAEIAGLFHKGGSLSAEQWKQKNDALTQEKERLERELSMALGPDALKDPLAGAGLRTLQSVLRPDEAFVDIYRYTYGQLLTKEEERYGAVITASSGGPVLVDLGASEKLNSVASAWRSSVLRDQGAEEQWRALSAAVWGPLATSLPKAVRRVYLSPDGELARIPWQFMPSSSPATNDVLLSQRDSARELFMLRRRGRTGINTTTARNLLLVGGVDFDAGSSAGGGGGSRYKELPSTESEVKDIEALAKANRFSVVELTGAGASKGAVEARLAGSTYAHLATHGFFYTEPERASPVTQAATRAGAQDLSRARNVRNPLVESGLALAGANAPDASTTQADGILTAEEMVGLDLTRCEMVTLSACDTGRGEQVTGQGVIGLRSAVIAAGARGVVMSLWKVPDEATSELMKAFYTNLWSKRMTPAESLLRAQEQIRDESSGRFRQPRNWAGWVLTGESW